MQISRRRPSLLLTCLAVCLLVFAALVLASFPWDTDVQRHDPAAREAEARRFYSEAYSAAPADAAREAKYIEVAREAARRSDVAGKIRWFVDSYGLRDKRILDVGAGRGYLQDAVRDYTALDVSPSVQRFFHKPFVLGSATAMPFQDNEFDAVWSVWVLEHVPNPEQALSEMRRVLKPGGLILLAPAWFCEPWAAGGYEVRPYSDFSLPGKLVKATIPVRRAMTPLLSIPIRAAREISARGGAPTAFHYRRLKPNYDRFWTNDSDAVNSMDPHEAMLWFESRGDRCVTCPPATLGRLRMPPQMLVIRVRKP